MSDVDFIAACDRELLNSKKKNGVFLRLHPNHINVLNKNIEAFEQVFSWLQKLISQNGCDRG